MVNGMYLYRALKSWPLKVLYSTVLPFTHSHTRSFMHLCAALSLSHSQSFTHCSGHFGVQDLAKGHFGTRNAGEIEPPTLWLVENHTLTPEPTTPVECVLLSQLGVLWLFCYSVQGYLENQTDTVTISIERTKRLWSHNRPHVTVPWI